MVQARRLKCRVLRAPKSVTHVAISSSGVINAKHLSCRLERRLINAQPAILKLASNHL